VVTSKPAIGTDLGQRCFTPLRAVTASLDEQLAVVQEAVEHGGDGGGIAQR